MDPVTLILTALAAGAAAGAKDTASTAVKDAYAGLKAKIKTLLSRRKDGELVLARYEESPRTWEAPLASELAAAGADKDEGLVTAAQAVLSMADEPGWRAGKYTVQIHGGQGVQVGDRNVQHNVFGTPPER
jgi:hypothetical protein